MKKLFSTLLILTLISTLSALSAGKVFSAGDNQLITQLNVVDNDSTFKYLYLYDNGNKVLECKYFMLDSIWIRQSLTEWVFDGNNCILQRERTWKNNSWQIIYTIDYSYSNNLLQSETHTAYSGNTTIPVKKIENRYIGNLLNSKAEYSWNSSLWNLTLATDFHYNSDQKTDSVWINSYQSGTLNNQLLSAYQYNNNGLLVSDIQKQKLASNWINTDSITWFYYPNSNLVQTQKYKKWNPNISNWENFQRIDYQYNDSNQILKETYQHWKMMFWENDVQYNYKYDGNYNLLKKTLSMPIYEDWRGLISINYSDIIAKKANTIESKFEFWGGNTGELTTSFIPFMFNDEIAIKRGRSIRLGYQQFKDALLSNSTIKNDPNFIRVFPNPSTGIFYVNSHEFGIKFWSITDLNGRMLKKDEQTMQSDVIDITDLPKGVYILRIVTPENQYFQKLIKQ